jgi:hypothetical protein
MIAYTTTLNKTRVNPKVINLKLRAIAKAGAALMDLYSYEENGRRVFVDTPIKPVENAFVRLNLALQHHGVSESTYITEVSGNVPVTTFEGFAVVAIKHVVTGYLDSQENNGGAARIVVKRAGYDRLSLPGALTLFATEVDVLAALAEDVNGDVELVLVRMVDFTVFDGYKSEGGVVTRGGSGVIGDGVSIQLGNPSWVISMSGNASYATEALTQTGSLVPWVTTRLQGLPSSGL